MEQSPDMSTFKSVLRKSGSSTCLRRYSGNAQQNNSLHDNSLNINDSATQTVTVINSHQLPNYSTERYYMLSEIEIKGHSISFLHESVNNDDDQSFSTHPTSASSTSTIEEVNLSNEDNKKDDCPPKSNNENNKQIEAEQEGRLDRIFDETEQAENLTTANTQPSEQATDQSLAQMPPAIILYLLWPSSCKEYTTAQAFAEGPVYNAIQAILQKIQSQRHDSTNTIESLSTQTNIGLTSNNFSPPVSPTRETSLNSMYNNSNKLTSSLLGPSTRKDHRIYVVIDRLINTTSASSNTSEYVEESQRKTPLSLNNENSTCQSEIANAESLVKIIATSKKMQLRSVIEGVSVGLSSDTRAAPGLDACLSAINLGEAERRAFFKKRIFARRGKEGNLFAIIGKKILGFGSTASNTQTSVPYSTDSMRYGAYNTSTLLCSDPNRSSIGIVTLDSEQLIGLDASRETDAVQGMSVHYLSCAEWYGQGDIRSFAARAQRMWRRKWVLTQYEGDTINDSDFDDVDSMAHYHETFSSETSGISKRRRKQMQQHTQQQQYKDDKQLSNQVDFFSDLMVLAFLIVVGTHIWTIHGEELKSFALKLLRF